MLRSTIQFGSFEELEQFLQNWRQWAWKVGDSWEEYDVGGAFVLFAACVENLRQFALDAELEDLVIDRLTDDQRAFIKKLTQQFGRVD
jgi:hypothetical protein